MEETRIIVLEEGVEESEVAAAHFCCGTSIAMFRAEPGE